MKNKILCVTPSEGAIGFLTAGKCYDIERTTADGQLVRVINDQGDEVGIFVGQSSLGTFRQLNMNALHTEALGMDMDLEETAERAKSRAFIATLCKGFTQQYQIFNGGPFVEKLYAALPDGRVFRSDEHDCPNANFNQPHFEWTHIPELSIDDLPKMAYTSFCGTYPVPEQCQ